MTEVAAYTPDMSRLWNRTVEACRNATFLHSRDYLSYHGERYADASAIITKRGKIIALCPAATSGDYVISHPGLTYGGILTASDASFFAVSDAIGKLTAFYRSRGLRCLKITPAPYIYNRRPSDDISYILTSNFGASVDSKLLSVVDLDCIHLSTLRRRCIKKAEKLHLSVMPTDRLDDFYEMLTVNLATRHNGASPVHSLSDLKILMARFPRNILLYGAFDGNRMLASTLLYDCPTAVKTQYIASTPEGRDTGAVDLLLSTVANLFSPSRRYLDLGSSSADSGYGLNPGLIFQKEGFGARYVTLNTYTVNL